MKINEEKEHIYSMMRDITSERRKLSDMYYSLKERLDELNKLEHRGLEEINIKGYVDLHNENNKKLMIANVKRETEHIIDKLEKENLVKPEPSLAMKEENQFKKIDEGKSAKSAKSSKKVTKQYVSKEKIESAIIESLKEYGMPCQLDVLQKLVEGRVGSPLSKHNFRYTILKKLVDSNEKVTRPADGFIQYQSDSI